MLLRVATVLEVATIVALEGIVTALCPPHMRPFVVLLGGGVLLLLVVALLSLAPPQPLAMKARVVMNTICNIFFISLSSL